jgi:hypothetical protein
MSSKKAELSAEDVESCIYKMIAEPPFDAQFLAFLGAAAANLHDDATAMLGGWAVRRSEVRCTERQQA